MRRSVAAPAVVVLLSVIAGGWLLQRGIDRSDNMYVRVRVLQEVMDRVESSFVEEVDGDALYDSAIDAIIRDLGDPHTSFIRAAEYENLRIRTEGEYGGVGLEVTDGEDYVTVVSAIPGAERAGRYPCRRPVRRDRRRRRRHAAHRSGRDEASRSARYGGHGQDAAAGHGRPHRVHHPA